MEICIKLESAPVWFSKLDSVIFVKNEEDIDNLFSLLVAQDGYWKDYKHLIKLIPEKLDNLHDIELHCEYCGKTDIDVSAIQEQIEFFIYQVLS